MTLFSILVSLISLGFAVVCALKGKYITAVIGFFIVIVGIVGAIRLAKPESWWANNRYDDERLQSARERFGD